MTYCPECMYLKIETVLVIQDELQDDDHAVNVTKLRCPNCGCEFELVERFEIEIRVCKHGTGASA